MFKTRIGGSLAGLLCLATIAACGSAPPSKSARAASKFLPCVLSDGGGFDDRSFNQQAYEGVKAAADGGRFKAVQSKTPNDYTSNIEALVSSKCNVIVAAGFALVAPVKAAAQKFPTTDFVMVDDDSIKAPNVKSVVFSTDECGFLGGYVAASYSKSRIVATYGGDQFPAVTMYMNGIEAGVHYFNEKYHSDVRLLGWDSAKQNGTFVGNFTDQNASRAIASNFLDNGADVVIPVAGSLYQGAAAAIRASSTKAVLGGVDADLYATDSDGNKDLILVSMVKNVRTVVEDVVSRSAKSETFDNTPYVGNLANGGVGLSPFHDFESAIPERTRSDLKVIMDGIVAGKVTIPEGGA